MIRIERRLEQPGWLNVAVPVGSLVLAFGLSALVLVATGHDPLQTFRRLIHAAFGGQAQLTETVVSATPLAFTGLCAAVAFRMQLFNIGGEGQLYIGAITAAQLLNRHGRIEDFPPPLLGARRELALLFKDLATLRSDAPLFSDVDALRWRGPTDAFVTWAERMQAPRLVERSARAKDASASDAARKA